MSLLQEIWPVSKSLDTPALLAYLIGERFPGRTIVTASLKASSIVVLKMVADADPATPVLFCQPGFDFEESKTYRAEITEQLGLSNVELTAGHETEVRDGDVDHMERMLVEYENSASRSFELVHLNESLQGFDCWISAVGHVERRPGIKHRVDVEGRLIRVDPIIHWSEQDVQEFMRDNNLPYHKRAKRKHTKFKPTEISDAPYYSF